MALLLLAVRPVDVQVDLSAVEPVPSDELGGKKKKVRRANARNYSRNVKVRPSSCNIPGVLISVWQI